MVHAGWAMGWPMGVGLIAGGHKEFPPMAWPTSHKENCALTPSLIQD